MAVDSVAPAVDTLPDTKEWWQAVLSRDGRYDGRFVCAVKTTGVYCRPSCPSRRPLRENVRFFPIPEAAEQAGFRSCLRCQPHLHPVQDPQLVMVREACRLIQESNDRIPTLAELG